jgi:hypothetical protein
MPARHPSTHGYLQHQHTSDQLISQALLSRDVSALKHKGCMLTTLAGMCLQEPWVIMPREMLKLLQTGHLLSSNWPNSWPIVTALGLSTVVRTCSSSQQLSQHLW